MARMFLLAVGLLSCNAFVVPSAPGAVSVRAAVGPAAAVVPRVESAAMMARTVAKKPVKKVVKKPVKKVVKKPVKKVVKKPVKKVVKKAKKGASYAMMQRASTGGGTDSVTKLGQEIVSTLLTPTQLAFVTVWLLIAAKFLVFYER